MTPLASLTSHVLRRPDDDVARLVYADWVEEHAGEAARAAFIRRSVELAGLGPACKRRAITPCDCGPCAAARVRGHGRCRYRPASLDFTARCRCRRCAAARAAWGIYARHATGWRRQALAPVWDAYQSRLVASLSAGGRGPVARSPAAWAEFDRGFVGRLALGPVDLAVHGRRLLETHPVARVDIQDRSGWVVASVEIDPPGSDYGWQGYFYRHRGEADAAPRGGGRCPGETADYEDMTGWGRSRKAMTAGLPGWALACAENAGLI